MLHEFVAANREELIRRCRAKVEVRSVPPPTPAELEFGVPRFLDQLVDALRESPRVAPRDSRSAAQHGRDLQLQGSPCRKWCMTTATSASPSPTSPWKRALRSASGTFAF